MVIRNTKARIAMPGGSGFFQKKITGGSTSVEIAKKSRFQRVLRENSLIFGCGPAAFFLFLPG
jgi:hypothetical protein